MTSIVSSEIRLLSNTAAIEQQLRVAGGVA